jgi:hypothetical protein
MPKKKKSLRTSIGVVLDESGSMMIREDETRKTFNDYFDEIEKEDSSAKVTVAKFSQGWPYTEEIRFLCRNESVENMPYLDTSNYVPSGGTPLLDAVGRTIRELEQTTADRYLLVILTDGQENASREFTQAQIKSLIRDKEASEKWTVVFLGAGVDAWSGAQFIGITTPGTVFGYSGAKGTTEDTGKSLSSATRSYLASNLTADTNFLAEEKKKKVTSTPSA